MELEILPLQDDIGHLQLKGRLDPQGMKEVDTRFREETANQDRAVIVDMSRVTFITSLGIGMLIDCATKVTGKGHAFVLVEPLGHVHQVLRKTGIYRVIPRVASLPEAILLAKSPPALPT